MSVEHFNLNKGKRKKRKTTQNHLLAPFGSLSSLVSWLQNRCAHHFPSKLSNRQRDNVISLSKSCQKNFYFK